MQKPTPMGSKPTSTATNGDARRQCLCSNGQVSWIDCFLEQSKSLESAPIFRRWAAITSIGAVLEQKAFIVSKGSNLYPNIYTFLIGHPGVGKSVTLKLMRRYLNELPETCLAPTSISTASLYDALKRSKRTITQYNGLDPFVYNTLFIMISEYSHFMHEYNKMLVGALTDFYDCDFFSEEKRGRPEDRIKMERPQLSMLCATTPSDILAKTPQDAWDQGFMSRSIMIFSDERPMMDDIFDVESAELSKELIHDLKCINGLVGQFAIADEYRNAIANWRKLGQPPIPTHPRLIHYNTRRLAHLLKLSMVSSANRSDHLRIELIDFNCAMSWLIQAESLMGDIFQAGTPGADARAIDEIYHFVAKLGRVSEGKITRFAMQRTPIHTVERAIKLMIDSGMIRAMSVDKAGMRQFEAIKRED